MPVEIIADGFKATLVVTVDVVAAPDSVTKGPFQVDNDKRHRSYEFTSTNAGGFVVAITVVTKGRQRAPQVYAGWGGNHCCQSLQ